ncbi:hypothetical protein J8402_15145 [Chromohalobacter israelensis]|uniref:hypothetical protein n=1 Tax=Chromohalobacter israelensis TaxID=141390 RepID=UPI003AF7C506
MADYRKLKDLVAGDTLDENILLPALEEIAMAPRMRALQQKGRFEALPIFKDCAAIIEAGVVSYYRENYISAYLTLVPVVEGVILRWLGYSGQGGKPSFKQVKRFIANSYRRQPCPGNPLFHEIYVTVADKLLTEHLFKPSGDGEAHANFNRHLAAHLLNDSQFGTKENCVRLCLLLDVMSELYIYEMYCQDPRFYLSGEEVQLKCEAYIQASMDRAGFCTPERKLLIKKNANKAMETDASKAGVANG